MNKKYINRIIKKLQCSKSKKLEIKERLTSDFLSELESGENARATMGRMGTPQEIAEEFNVSFSEEEKKKYKREKRTKILIFVLSIILIIGSLIRWALPKTYDIEESKLFQKEVVLEEAKDVIRLVEQKDFETLANQSDKTMKEYMVSGKVSSILGGFDFGENVSFGETYVTEIHQFWIKNAIVQMKVNYEESSVLYTVSFNKDMELTGLWLQ